MNKESTTYHGTPSLAHGVDAMRRHDRLQIEPLEITGEHRGMTRRKACQLAAEPGAEVVGAIIRTAGGSIALVQGGAVRWLTEGALWELMHPGPDVKMEELPKLPVVPDSERPQGIVW